MARRLIEEDRAVAEEFAAFNMKESTAKNEETVTKIEECSTKKEESSSSSEFCTMAPPLFKFNVGNM